MGDIGESQITELVELAGRMVEAGPFYNGIDDDFCAVCGAYFLMAEDHKADCAYVLLRRMLRPDLEPEPLDQPG